MLKKNQKAEDKPFEKNQKKIKNKETKENLKKMKNEKIEKTINKKSQKNPKKIEDKKVKKSKLKKENKKNKKERIPLRLRIVNNSKLLAKDLKRSRWVDIKENRKTFIKVSIFIVVIALALFGIAVGFGALWSSLGVGLDG